VRWHPAFISILRFSYHLLSGSYDNLSGTASGSKSGTTSGESDIPTRRAKTGECQTMAATPLINL